MTTNPRANYLKNVLGIKSVMLPENFQKNSVETLPQKLEVHFQTKGSGNVLFLGAVKDDSDRTFAIDELQLLEKIIVALKLHFNKTSIATVSRASRENLLSFFQENQFSYIFLLDNQLGFAFPESQLNEEVVINNIRLFSTFHPREMIDNPDLKKIAWTGFKKIMESLPK